jgi:hypothetical protein
LVLNLEVTDLPGKLLLRRAGDDKQQRSVNVPHGVNLRKLKHHKELTSFSHTGSRFGRQIPDAAAWTSNGPVVAIAA